MSRGNWTNIRQSNRFYQDSYRRGVTALLVSILLNVCLAVGLYYAYFSLPERDFYATDGITPPLLLKALNEPNNSSKALLPNDQNDYDNINTAPQ